MPPEAPSVQPAVLLTVIAETVSQEVSDSILWSIKDYKGKQAIMAFRQNVETLAD